MNVDEKRDFIHSHLHQVGESLIDQFYETLCKEEVLKSKLINRAQKSENDIHTESYSPEPKLSRKPIIFSMKG